MRKDDFHVLLIDDQSTMGTTVRNTIGMSHKQVAHFLAPSEALELARSRRFDLFLIDYLLGNNVSGIDVAKNLRQKYLHVPQIMITAYRSDAVVNACRQRKIPLVEKPFWDDKLKDTVHFYLELSRQPQRHWQDVYPEWQRHWGLPDEPVSWALSDHDYMFAQMWSDHANDAVKKTARIVTPREEAKDIVSETYLAIVSKSIRFKNGHHFRAYLLKSVLRKALNWLKKKKPDSGEALLLKLVDDSPSHVETLANQQMLSKLKTMLHQLPEKDRTVLRLYCEEKSYQQIAKETGLTEKQVRNKIYWTKRRWKKN